jgi:hypothetical protein
LLTDVLGLFLLGVTLGVQEIGEEKQLDDDKKDKQLDAYDQPQCLSHGHVAETIIIQMENTRPETLTIFGITHRVKVKSYNQLAKLMIKNNFANK